MAYMSQERKKELAPKIKAICKKHGVKATLAVEHYSTLILNVKSSSIDFDLGERPYESINEYHIESHFKKNEPAKAFLLEVYDAMMDGNHNNSDAMTDYFDVGWYIGINVGTWKKAYVITE